MTMLDSTTRSGEGPETGPVTDFLASLSELTEKGLHVVATVEAEHLGDRGRLLLARAERGMARGLRLAAKQLDHAAFRLDCAGRKLASEQRPASSPAAAKVPSEPSTDAAADDMDDELLSPHLA